jgi:hypothetical protein
MILASVPLGAERASVEQTLGGRHLAVEPLLRGEHGIYRRNQCRSTLLHLAIGSFEHLCARRCGLADVVVQGQELRCAACRSCSLPAPHGPADNSPTCPAGSESREYK